MVEPLLAGDMERQYLILPRTEEGTVGYEQKMVLHNKIDGLLSVEIRTIDQEEQYYYDVTGKKSLEEFLEQRKLTAENIAFIYESIIDEIRNAKQYLLQENNFILSKETVYLDYQNKQLYLCYKEDYQKEVQKQLIELTEYFMNQIDYQDEKAVLYIYGIYKLVRQDNCTFADIKEIFEKYGQTEIQEQKPEEVSRQNSEVEETEVFPEQEEKFTFPEVQPAGISQKSSEGFITEKAVVLGINLVVCVVLYVMKWFTQEVTGQIDLKKCVLTGVILLAGDSFIFEKMKKKQSDEEIVLSTEEEDDDGATVLLYNSLAQYEFISKEGVTSLEFSQQDLPVTIGKSRECGRGYLGDKIISRRHAEFRWNAGKLQVADLGSTNGTSLNGEELLSKQYYDVQDEDKITFGNVVFTIRFKGV